MSKTRQELVTELEALCSQFKEINVNILVVVAEYAANGKDVHFDTYIHIEPQPQADVSEDHIVLDCIRELAGTWSEKVHVYTPEPA